MTQRRAERLTGYEVRRASIGDGKITYRAFCGQEVVAEGTHLIDTLALEILVREVYRLNSREALKRHDWRCARCRRMRRLQIHHRRYRSHGGTHQVENLEPVCADCHKNIHRLERSK